jgi:hypothetical protein
MASSFRNLGGDAHVAGLGDVLRWQLGLHDEKRPRSPKRGVEVPVVDNDGRASLAEPPEFLREVWEGAGLSDARRRMIAIGQTFIYR